MGQDLCSKRNRFAKIGRRGAWDQLRACPPAEITGNHEASSPMRETMMRAAPRTLGLTLILGLLAACGPRGGGRATAPPAARPPWVPNAGLWLQTFTSGEQAGFQTVTCFAPGHGDVFGDQRPAETAGQMTCEAVQRRLTPDGWTADQRCALRGHAGLYQYVAHGSGESAVTVRVSIVDPQTRQALSTPADVRFRRVGVCPAGFAPGDMMQISQPEPDGQYRIVTPGLNGGPGTVRPLAVLPPQIAALRVPGAAMAPPAAH